MRRAVLTTMTLLFASFACAEPASKAERAALCKSIEQNAEQEAADMAPDRKACLDNASIASTAAADGKRTLDGRIAFNAPARPRFTMTCKATYAPPLTKKTVVTLESRQ